MPPLKNNVCFFVSKQAASKQLLSWIIFCFEAGGIQAIAVMNHFLFRSRRHLSNCCHESFFVSKQAASTQLLSWISPNSMTCFRLVTALMHVVIMPLLKCKSKDPITGQLQLPQLSPRNLSRSCRGNSTGTCRLQTANLVSSEHMGQKWPYLH